MDQSSCRIHNKHVWSQLWCVELRYLSICPDSHRHTQRQRHTKHQSMHNTVCVYILEYLWNWISLLSSLCCLPYCTKQIHVPVLYFVFADESQYRNLVVWLEDQKIRHYKIDDRAALRNICAGDWQNAYKKVTLYIHNLTSPLYSWYYEITSSWWPYTVTIADSHIWHLRIVTSTNMNQYHPSYISF